jgi:hypothetical protein
MLDVQCDKAEYRGILPSTVGLMTQLAQHKVQDVLRAWARSAMPPLDGMCQPPAQSLTVRCSIGVSNVKREVIEVPCCSAAVKRPMLLLQAG